MNRKTRGVVSYILIAFGMAWAFWCAPLTFGLTLHSPFYILFLLPGAFAPAIAAIVVRKWVTREGLADAGLRLNLRKSWRYYLIAWLLPVPVVAIIVLLAVALRLSQPDFSLERAMHALGGGQSSVPQSVPLGLRFALVAIQGVVLAIVSTPILWGEEFGWRGYLQIRLLAHRPFLAAITTGMIWGVWHYPINLQGYNYPDSHLLGLFIFPVWTALLSIVLGWLRQKTRSVWSASLAHAATNTIGGSLTSLLFMGGPNWVLVSYAGVLSWVPLGALCVWIVLSGQLQPKLCEGPQGELHRPQDYSSCE